jgi:hypothetical protein
MMMSTPWQLPHTFQNGGKTQLNMENILAT